jgi:hypothetical protein
MPLRANYQLEDRSWDSTRPCHNLQVLSSNQIHRRRSPRTLKVSQSHSFDSVKLIRLIASASTHNASTLVPGIVSQTGASKSHAHHSPWDPPAWGTPLGFSNVPPTAHAGPNPFWSNPPLSHAHHGVQPQLISMQQQINQLGKGQQELWATMELSKHGPPSNGNANASAVFPPTASSETPLASHMATNKLPFYSGHVTNSHFSANGDQWVVNDGTTMIIQPTLAPKPIVNLPKLSSSQVETFEGLFTPSNGPTKKSNPAQLSSVMDVNGTGLKIQSLFVSPGMASSELGSQFNTPPKTVQGVNGQVIGIPDLLISDFPCMPAYLPPHARSRISPHLLKCEWQQHKSPPRLSTPALWQLLCLTLQEQHCLSKVVGAIPATMVHKLIPWPILSGAELSSLVGASADATDNSHDTSKTEDNASIVNMAAHVLSNEMDLEYEGEDMSEDELEYLHEMEMQTQMAMLAGNAGRAHAAANPGFHDLVKKLTGLLSKFPQGNMTKLDLIKGYDAHMFANEDVLYQQEKNRIDKMKKMYEKHAKTDHNAIVDEQMKTQQAVQGGH